MNSIKFIWKYIAASKKDAILTFAILISLAGLNIFPGLIIKNIFDKGILIGEFDYVLIFSAILLVLYSINSFLNYRSTFILNKCSQKLIANLRNDVTQQVINLPMEFFTVYESGYITARINEVNNVASLFSVSTMKVIITIFEFIGVCIVLFTINPIVTIILLIISPIFYIIGRKNMKAVSKSSIIAIEQSAKLNNKIQQSIQGMEEVKNLSVEDKETQKIKKENEKMLKMGIKQSNSYAIGLEVLSFIGTITGVILLVVGGGFVIFQDLTIGDYMVFSNYIGKLYAPMQSVAVLSITLVPALVSLKRITSFMNEICEEEEDQGKEELSGINSIEFQNVCFKYKSQRDLLFNNMNFNLSGNDKLMVKGGNGTGKTTILRLLLALYPIASGDILYNQNSHSRYKKSSIRKHMSVVSQKIYLFNGSIEDNIRYGLEISDSEYSQAMKKAEMKALLNQLPLDDNVIILENGCNLSGGQIQRIALARGLLKNADLFLFDEITSNLDVDGIDTIKKFINETLKDKLCIFVEHGNIMDNLCNKQITL